MILRPEQIKLLHAGKPLTMANGGSDSNSDSSQSTTTTSTNNVNEQDRRIVASDAAIAVTGSGTVSKSETSNFTDSSTRDSGNSTSTTINNTTTDFGAVAKSLDGMGQMGTQVVNFSNDAVKGAIDSLNRTGQLQLEGLHSVFDFAQKSSANSLTEANQVLGFAQAATQSVQQAWTDAKQGPEQKIMLAIVGAAAVVAVAFALKGH